MNVKESTARALHKQVRTLEAKVRSLERANSALRHTEWEFRLLADNVPALFAYVDPSHRYRYVNKRYEDLVGVPRAEIVGKHLSEVLGERTYATIRPAVEKALGCERVFFEAELAHHPAGPRYMSAIMIPDCCKDAKGGEGRTKGLFVLVVDITEQKKVEELLRLLAVDLDRKNIALREVLEQVESEKTRPREDVVANVTNTILPHLAKIRLCEVSRRHVDLIRYEIENLTSSFGSQIGRSSLGLTPREIELCDMIRAGLTSKEIAGLLNLSIQTVDKHRRNIRRKIGIAKEEINLTNYLRNM